MNHTERINAHLEHAKRKHPHFADKLDFTRSKETVDEILKIERHLLSCQIADGEVVAHGILNCELAEVYEAIANGRADDAVEEIYDAVAVLLRMAEWVNEKGCK